MIDAVVFDMDGVLVDSEHLWDEVREQLARERGGTYGPEQQRAMMGMSSPEWSAYMHEAVGLPDSPEEITALVLAGMRERYAGDPPLLPGAVAAVERLAAEWPLAIASSSNRELIDAVLEHTPLGGLFGETVSSEEVARGKPSPDVYLEAARRLGVDAVRCGAVEDSHNGIRSAKAAGMRVVAVPNPHYPPDDEALALADVTVPSIGELQVEHFAV